MAGYWTKEKIQAQQAKDNETSSFIANQNAILAGNNPNDKFTSTMINGQAILAANSAQAAATGVSLQEQQDYSANSEGRTPNAAQNTTPTSKVKDGDGTQKNKKNKKTPSPLRDMELRKKIAATNERNSFTAADKEKRLGEQHNAIMEKLNKQIAVDTAKQKVGPVAKGLSFAGSLLKKFAR